MVHKVRSSVTETEVVRRIVPATCKVCPGSVVPMPTLPELFITNLSVVPRAVELAIENLLLETSYPIVHEPAVEPENSNADFVAEYNVVRLFGVVVPMPMLPVVVILILSVSVLLLLV